MSFKAQAMEGVHGRIQVGLGVGSELGNSGNFILAKVALRDLPRFIH